MHDARLVSLVDVGFSDKEARIFVALSELGEATASQIATRANLKRPIVYLVLEKLVKNGAVLELPRQRVKRYACIEPSKLVHVLQANIEHLRTMLPLFRVFERGGRQKPQVEMFETKEAVASVFRMLEQGKVCRYVSMYSRHRQYFPHELARWATRGADAKYRNHSKHLCVDEPEGRGLALAMQGNKYQSFRFLPKNTDLAMDLSIADDIVVLTSFQPLFAIVLRSPDLARSLAVVFDLAWERGKPGRGSGGLNGLRRISEM